KISACDASSAPPPKEETDCDLMIFRWMIPRQETVGTNCGNTAIFHPIRRQRHEFDLAKILYSILGEDVLQDHHWALIHSIPGVGTCTSIRAVWPPWLLPESLCSIGPNQTRGNFPWDTYLRCR